MKTKITIAFVLSAFIGVGTVSVHAYTYACEEGKFQIDVPEGWEIEVNMELFPDLVPFPVITGIILHPKGVSTDDLIMIILVRDYDKLNQQLKKILGEDLTLDGLHKLAVKLTEDDGCEIIADTYLTVGQVSVMNLDSGFVLRSKTPDNSIFVLGGHFVKGNRVYNLGGGGDYDIYQANEDKIIKALNSFRALD